MNKTNHPFILPVLFIGFLVWLIATLAFRFAGQFFFITESPIILTLLYFILIPSMVFLSLFTFQKFNLSGFEKTAAGILLVLPGMIIDTFAIQFFEAIFPNMPSSRAASFGSWLMWAYTIVILTALISSIQQKQVKH
ncbi:DUF5367 domain-containing protein [Myroides sp. 1354]|uniref:DUF5367 domain-containing protein n=1 Tax=unclassified Myroides TaxID=2642485 RepID=UPI0025750040|nr:MULTISPECIES: DUF5367 domain-containing protein [unclassified Myroides]MDM1046441.1 DUF5367 domain-containing protein [Myroides sp. R163-1]MDM1057378.1 DUF5367 domain-containing protein [Myroides sp. 1354]MDM1070609.1 DUF5367 domain-containing protein [Myroides sp. 1372]